MRIRYLVIAAVWLALPAYAALPQPQEKVVSEERVLTRSGPEITEPAAAGENERNMIALMREHRFQERNIELARQTMRLATREGLPTGPLVDKAKEGIARQAGEEEIVAAMETVRHRYSYAHQVARALAPDGKVDGAVAEAIADCLAAGVKTEDMDRVADRLRVRARQLDREDCQKLCLQTMLAARSMARLGVSSDEIAITVTQALQHQNAFREMEQLRHNFAEEAEHNAANHLAHRHSGELGKGGAFSGRDATGNAATGNDSGGGNSGGNSGNSGGSSGDGGSDSSGGSGGSGSGGGSGGSGGSGGGSGGNGGGSGGSGGSGGGSGGRG